MTRQPQQAGQGRLRLLGQHLPLTDRRTGRRAGRGRRRADRRRVHQRGDEPRGDRRADRPARTPRARRARLPDRRALRAPDHDRRDRPTPTSWSPPRPLHVDRMLRYRPGRRQPVAAQRLRPRGSRARVGSARPLVRRGRGLRGDPAPPSRPRCPGCSTRCVGASAEGLRRPTVDGVAGLWVMTSEAGQRPVVVVPGPTARRPTGVAPLAERGASVRAVVRRAGTAPRLDGLEERSATSPTRARRRGPERRGRRGHNGPPDGRGRATQQRVGVEATPALRGRPATPGWTRLVHVSTAAVYDRRPGSATSTSGRPGRGRRGRLPVTKRDADAALAEVDGITRVLVRPPAILGPGETSVWNTLRPARSATRGRPGTPCRTRRSPGSTSTTSPPWWPTSPPAASRGRPTPPRARSTGACTAGQRRGGTGDDARLLRDGDRRPRRGPGLGGRPGLDRPDPADRARAWGWTPPSRLATALDHLHENVRRTVA